MKTIEEIKQGCGKKWCFGGYVCGEDNVLCTLCRAKIEYYKLAQKEILEKIKKIENKAISSYLREKSEDHISFEPEDWKELKESILGVDQE